jgi:hypothetical protein
MKPKQKETKQPKTRGSSNNKQAKKEPSQNQKPRSQEETTKKEGNEDLKQQTTQHPDTLRTPPVRAWAAVW